MQKNGIIFGKFYPLHIGHVDFIQRASGYVENLYVVVCTDDDRDKKLFEDNSKDTYDLAQECIDKKTHFALDILYHSDENFSNWKIPAYIKNGLSWLKKDQI